MPTLFRTGRSNKPRSQASICAASAGANKPREWFDAVPTAIGRRKTKGELDGEASAEALLKKAQSAFGSKE
jgi:hypothetical protein